jgi:DNA polymerase-3 subunit epsilon
MPFFFDTETSGLWNFKSDYKDTEQPFLVQVAGILDDGYENILGEFNFLVELPKDKEIHPKALEVHGITRDKTEKGGLPCELSATVFSYYLLCTDIIVGHNIKFDIAVMSKYLHDSNFGPQVSELQNHKTRCTMLQSKGVCKLPGKWGYKWPKLEEAYRMLVDKDGFEGAHDAMADVRACREIYYKLDWSS